MIKIIYNDNPPQQKTVFRAILEYKRRFMKCRIFFETITQKSTVSRCNFQIHEKYDFNIQHLTHLFLKKWKLYNFWENGEPKLKNGQ